MDNMLSVEGRHAMPKWLRSAVFYEVYPQSFKDTNGDGIGDIQGIIDELEYIKCLGCNAIWLNPCFDSPFQDAGYDVRNYKKVARRYGTNGDLKRCFSEAHKKGMRVLLDLVPGHTSITHRWFRMSQKDEENSFTDRFIWTDSVWNKSLDPQSISGISERNGSFCLNFFAFQPALNYGFYERTALWQKSIDDPASIATRVAIEDVMCFWLAAGCDGFRVDMAGSLVKNDPERIGTCTVWRDILSSVRRKYPEMAVVSEWSDPPKAINKAGFDMDFYLSERGNGYVSLMRDAMPFFSKEGKGDITRFLDEYLPWYEETKGKGYISLITGNHDTMRISRTLDDRQLRLAYAFLFTMPGVPFLYYGDEIGMRYLPLKSKEGGYQRTGSRTPMQWGGGKNLGFSDASPESLYLPVDGEPDAPTVQKEDRDPASLLSFVRSVLTLRREHQELGSDPNFGVVYAEKGTCPFVYRRGSFLVTVNPSSSSVRLSLSESGRRIFGVGSSSLENGVLSMEGQSFGVFSTR
jgi:maltose alpha-D-glucosyltransferase/alpha-amylase